MIGKSTFQIVVAADLC